MYMKRTTIELDEDLLARAKRALGAPTARATVEEALRRVAEEGEREAEQRATAQARFLDALPGLADLDVLRSEKMWR
jgi:Arc/MetJ family transcription regulator